MLVGNLRDLYRQTFEVEPPPLIRYSLVSVPDWARYHTAVDEEVSISSECWFFVAHSETEKGLVVNWRSQHSSMVITTDCKRFQGDYVAPKVRTWFLKSVETDDSNVILHWKALDGEEVTTRRRYDVTQDDR